MLDMLYLYFLSDKKYLLPLVDVNSLISFIWKSPDQNDALSSIKSMSALLFKYAMYCVNNYVILWIFFLILDN